MRAWLDELAPPDDPLFLTIVDREQRLPVGS